MCNHVRLLSRLLRQELLAAKLVFLQVKKLVREWQRIGGTLYSSQFASMHRHGQLSLLSPSLLFNVALDLYTLSFMYFSW